MMNNKRFFSIWLTILFSVVSILSCKSSREVVQAPAPAPVQVVPEKKPEPVQPPVAVKKSTKLRIALVMSFELSANFNADTTESGYTEMDITPGSLPAIHFFEGAKIAMDSLASDSVLVTLKAYDAPADSAAASKLFGGPMLRDFDYVIAGIQPALAVPAALAAEKSGIRLILLQAPSAAFLEGRPNVALAGASTFTQCRETAGILAQQHPSANFIVVSRKVKRENELAAAFVSALKSNPGLSPVYEFDATTKPVTDLSKQLRQEKRNIIVVASSDEAFVKNAVLSLNDMGMSGIYLCGLPTWAGFESIDFMSLENLKFFLFDNNFTDLSDPSVTAYRKLFISKYNADPLPQAFSGFELVYGLGMGSNSTGLLCDKLTEIFKSAARYRFQSAGAGNGCENIAVSLLEIDDYSIKKVK
jgi:hypothetical protein